MASRKRTEMKEERSKKKEEAEDRYTAFEKIVNLFALLYYEWIHVKTSDKSKVVVSVTSYVN